MLIVQFQVSQNFEKVSWLSLQKSNYQLKFDFQTMTFCPQKCQGCVITMTFKRSTMTIFNSKNSVNLEYYIKRTQVYQNLEQVSWLALQNPNYQRKSDFRTHDILSKKMSWLRHNHDISKVNHDIFKLSII